MRRTATRAVLDTVTRYIAVSIRLLIAEGYQRADIERVIAEAWSMATTRPDK